MGRIDTGDEFGGLGLRDELRGALVALGYEEPTPIQREAIPPLLDGRDVLANAATGTGKTAAFALPLLQRTAPHGERRGPQGLVLVPTRELAMQVSEAVHRYGGVLGARVMPVYGGQPFGRQVRELQRGVDVVVATPGRALDHLARGTLRLDEVAVVVLDEADEMLDMGFADDIEALLDAVPDGRQTVLFSATVPPRIDGIARRHLRDPARIAIAAPAQSAAAPQVRETAYVVQRPHKPAALARILEVEAPTAAIVFCRTRLEVEQLTETLNGRGHRAEALHGGIGQEQRDRVMGRLRAGAAELLVATDLAARGLDVEQLTHVVNFDVPSSPESYVHRIGRVGRAGREGVAITLAEPREERMLRNFERLTGRRIRIARIPTLADARARRLDLTQETLREALLDDDLVRFRAVVEPLVEEFDLMRIALAAVKLAQDAQAGGGEDEKEIPEPPVRRPPAGGDREQTRRSGSDGAGRAPAPGTTRLFIGAGRRAGIRPQDLVGAVTGESRLSGRDVGEIQIADAFSLVEVPESAADEVIAGLRAATLRGRKVTVRRERVRP